MIAISITALECTKFDFGLCSTPDPAGGAYSASPDPLAGSRSLLLREGKGRERRGKEGGKEVGERQGTGAIEGKEEGCQGKGREGEGKGGRRRVGGKTSKNIPSVNSCLRPWHTVHSETTTSASILAVAVLHQVAPGQMTWLEDPPPWLKPWLRPT